jgi:hypothetical protein
MSNDYGIVFVECMSFKPHEAHSWREGFLWHRKRHCGGRPMTQAEYWRAANPALGGRVKNEFLPPHKHRMFLSRWWSNSESLVFICDSHTVGCKYEYRVTREAYWVNSPWRQR